LPPKSAHPARGIRATTVQPSSLSLSLSLSLSSSLFPSRVRVSRLYGKNSIPSRGGNTFSKTLYNYAVRVDMLRDLRLAGGTAKRSLLYAAARAEMFRYHENRDRTLARARARFADFAPPKKRACTLANTRFRDEDHD